MSASSADFRIGVVTDVHVGPEARFGGKLRKLTHHARDLLAGFVAKMNADARPDLVLNLGDDIEDEGHDVDVARYHEVLGILGKLSCPVRHVAGNHDTITLSENELAVAWGRPPHGPLYYAEDIGPIRLVVLHTHETKDESVWIDEPQLSWLASELERVSRPVLVACHHSLADQMLTGNRWFERAPHICLVRDRRRVREMLSSSGKVLAVINGHLHWNHFDLHDGVAYVTLQSLIENLDDDAPGRAANAHALIQIQPRPTQWRLLVEIHGEHEARYQIEPRLRL